MSIYATLWVLRFPVEGDSHPERGWIEVLAQAVPSHIGTATPGHGYEEGDPYGSFLPPPVPVSETGNAQYLRAVVILTRGSLKGTERSSQEYPSPLLVFSGKEYANISFQELHARICSRLKADRAPLVATDPAADTRRLEALKALRGSAPDFPNHRV